MPRRRGDVRHYREGQKNQWRRTSANEVLRRTNGREKREAILYLAGPEDNDRALLLDKGVPRQNLFAIDRCRENILRLRGRRDYGVHGDMTTVLGSWPESRPVCALFLDFCCGLELSLLADLPVLLQRSVFERCIVMVNLQRGRDPSSNEFRAILERQGLVSDGLNRAKYLMGALSVLHGCLDVNYQAAQAACGVTLEQRLSYFHFVESLMKPTYYSYESGGRLTFDSVVFDAFGGVEASLAQSLGLADVPVGEVANYHREVESLVRGDFFNKRVARRLSAQFALRTMQARRSFPRRELAHA